MESRMYLGGDILVHNNGQKYIGPCRHVLTCRVLRTLRNDYGGSKEETSRRCVGPWDRMLHEGWMSTVHRRMTDISSALQIRGRTWAESKPLGDLSPDSGQRETHDSPFPLETKKKRGTNLLVVIGDPLQPYIRMDGSDTSHGTQSEWFLGFVPKYCVDMDLGPW